MRTTLLTLPAVLLSFAFSRVFAAEGGTEETRVLPIKGTPAISAIFWSVQSEVCVVQISFQPVPDGDKQPDHPKTQVWLLKGDGSVIPPSQKPSTIGISMANHTTESITYAFPPTAEAEACAVVIRIDDDFFVERLQPSGVSSDEE